MQHQKNHIATIAGILLFLTMGVTAQPNNLSEQDMLDSLDQARSGERHAFWLKELAFLYKSDRPATAHSYARSSLEIAEQLGNEKAIADALHVEGAVYWYQGKVAEASKAFFKALEIRERIDDKLGLAICQKIVARHRGKIELESVLGEGPRFLVYLPK